MVRRVRINKGSEAEYFFYEHPRDSLGKRKLTSLGRDLVRAKMKWAELERASVERALITEDERTVSALYKRYMEWVCNREQSRLSIRTLQDRKVLEETRPGIWESSGVGMTLLCDPKGQKLKQYGYFRSEFKLARDRAQARAAELGIEFVRFQFKDLRAKSASDMESMASARKLLGHTTESMTTKYVRNRVGEKVSPVLISGYAKREKA